MAFTAARYPSEARRMRQRISDVTVRARWRRDYGVCGIAVRSPSRQPGLWQLTTMTSYQIAEVVRLTATLNQQRTQSTYTYIQRFSKKYARFLDRGLNRFKLASADDTKVPGSVFTVMNSCFHTAPPAERFGAVQSRLGPIDLCMNQELKIINCMKNHPRYLLNHCT
eukprot:6185621-Pleurochrysis_carterae.AAC.1